MRTNVNRTYAWRVRMLKTLSKLITENSNAICDAVAKDLNRRAFIQEVFQMDPIVHEIDDVLEQLPKWMKPEQVPCPMMHGPGKCMILREPLGVCLILTAWNFPFWELFFPMVGAFAAGNNCLIKPSEMAPYSSNLIKTLMTKCFKDSEVGVVEGGIEVAKAITSAKVDVIIFTGSP